MIFSQTKVQVIHATMPNSDKSGPPLHELGERRIVLVEGSDGVGVDKAAGGSGEVGAGDAVSGALAQARQLEPAPGAVAGSSSDTSGPPGQRGKYEEDHQE
ncbi:unnamed protein product [Urochloa humidicola]